MHQADGKDFCLKTIGKMLISKGTHENLHNGMLAHDLEELL